MSQQRAAYRKMSAEVVGGLLQVAVEALHEARAAYGRIDLDDIETMIEMFRALWPGNSDVMFLRGVFEGTKTNWRAAADIFGALAAASQCLPRSRAMLVYALRAAGDPGWRAEAEALSESSDPNSRLIVCSMIAEDDLDRAIEYCGPAGAQQTAMETLELTKRLREEADAASDIDADETATTAPKPRALASDAPNWMTYRLRV